jgi:hypothetical protein
MNIKKTYIVGMLLTIAAVAVLPLLNSSSQSVHAASGAALTLSPASQSVTTGSNVTVSIVLNSAGNTINTVQSVFTYSTAHYSLVSITPGSSFTSFPNSPASGSIEFSAASTTPVSGGAVTVATVTLHATGTGTSALGLASVCAAGDYAQTCSAVYDAATSDNDLSTASGASFTVNAVPVTPPSNPTPTPTPTAPSSGSGSSSSKSSSSSSSTTKSTPASTSGSSSTTATTPAAAAAATPTTTTTNPAPIISDISANSSGTTSVTISWQTNLASSSVVEYGLTSGYGLTAQSGSLSTSHQVILNSLSQGTRYYFAVQSATATGASSTSGAQQVMTVGYAITIRVVDAHGKLIKGAVVTIDGQNRTSNSSGIVSFQNVSAGAQTVVIKAGNKVTKRSITVTANTVTGTSQLQQFSLSAVRGSTNSAIYVVTLAVIVIAAGGALFMPRNRLYHFPAMATANVDPDLHSVAMGPISDPTPTPTFHTSNGPVAGVKPHEPGQVITPESQNPADPTASSDDSNDPPIIQPPSTPSAS